MDPGCPSSLHDFVSRANQSSQQWHSFRLHTTMNPTLHKDPVHRERAHLQGRTGQGLKRARSSTTAARSAAALALATATVLTASQGAQAQPQPNGTGGYSMAFDQYLGENSPATSPDPMAADDKPVWLQANINPIAGGVNIELINMLKSNSEFITKVAFNLTESIQNLSSTCSDPLVITCSPNMVTQEFNAQSPVINLMNGAKNFDLAIDLPTRGNQNRFTQGERTNFQLFGTNLSPALFLSTNEPLGPGSVQGLWAAAKVQGLANGGSATIVDPPSSAVPGPLPLLGAGVALGFSRRLRRRISLDAAAA